jgi:hypothetical protein
VAVGVGKGVGGIVGVGVTVGVGVGVIVAVGMTGIVGGTTVGVAVADAGQVDVAVGATVELSPRATSTGWQPTDPVSERMSRPSKSVRFIVISFPDISIARVDYIPGKSLVDSL